jgi:hypothetical protein
MAGFLPYWIANPLTNFFGNRIDFSNFGRSTQEKGLSPSNYSTQQLLDRAFIWGGIIVGGAAGYFLKQQLQEEGSPYATALSITAGVLAGFFLTHAKVSQARVSHRMHLIEQINGIESGIKNCLDSYLTRCDEDDRAPVRANIMSLIEDIKQYSLSNQERSNATLTLLKRKAGLEHLLTSLTEDKQDSGVDSKQIAKFWKQERQILLNSIIEGPVDIQNFTQSNTHSM